MHLAIQRKEESSWPGYFWKSVYFPNHQYFALEIMIPITLKHWNTFFMLPQDVHLDQTWPIQGPTGRPQTRRPDRTEPGPARERGRLPRPIRVKKTFYLLNQFLFSFVHLLCVFGVGSGEHIFLIMHNKSCIVPTPKSNIFQALCIFGGRIRGTHLSNYAQQKLRCPNPKI